MMKILSLFSGIGAFEKALERLEIPYELVNYCEIDKYASKAYSLIHNVPESKNLGDITKVDETKLDDFDMLTYGFPCQPFSLAGLGLGVADPRGNLFFDALRILKEKKPEYAIAENVKNLVSNKFKDTFDIMVKCLEDAGYNNYIKVLDASQYGVPQHRERVFIISIRKDVDNGYFSFPEPLKSDIRLKDILENNVDRRYYYKNKELQFTPNKNSGDIKGFVNVGKYELANRVYTGDSICFTLRAKRNDQLIMIDNDFRYLTPLSCFRLMGFDDSDYYILKQNNISDSQLYKMAGNSIVVDVLYYIFVNLARGNDFCITQKIQKNIS